MVTAETLTSVSHLLQEEQNRSRALDRVLELLTFELEFALGLRWIADDDALTLRCHDVAAVAAAHREQYQDFIGFSLSKRFPPGEGGPGRVWLSRTSTAIDNIAEDKNLPRLLIALRCGLHSYVAFPLVSGKHIYGVFEFFTPEPVSADHRTLSILQAIGGMVGEFLSEV